MSTRMTVQAHHLLAAPRGLDVTATIPFQDAALCLDDDCSTVFHISAFRCPRCGSPYCALLAGWLERGGA